MIRLSEWLRGWRKDWFGKLSLLFVAVLIWKYVSVMEGYWWPETFQAVYFTIVFAAATELLLPLSRLFRLPLQLAGTIFIAWRISGYEGAGFRPTSADELVLWGQSVLSGLYPFIWIGLAIWLLLLLFGSWAVTRVRIFGTVGVCLLSLTIADSFTPIYLWDEVAWTVFVGLCWLVAEHFARFEREHPRSWKELLEYPAAFFLPIVLVLTIVMTSGVFVPEVAPVIKDPYTIWVESRGQTVNGFLGDKGIPLEGGRNADTRSGYSRNDTKLGEGFQFDYSPVMTVETSHRSYWRGETKSLYTGEGWLDSRNERNEQLLRDIGPGESLPLADDRGRAKTVKVTQTVTMDREDRYPVLFAAGPISSVQWIGSEDEPIPERLGWGAESWELQWPARNAGRFPKSYAVVSELIELDETELRKAKAEMSDEAGRRQYLQLPDSLPDRVRDLAAQLTEEAASDYDKAKAIETYLRMNYSYTNTPDLSKKRSDDFVDSFLFEIREGYCDYYSSAMVVLARAADLPARWVKGYAPGVTTDNLDMLQYWGAGVPGMPEIDPNGAGTYTVRNADAHSWVEIYFEGFGWIPFEPTAGFAFPYAIGEEEAASLPETEAEPEPAQDPAEPVREPARFPVAPVAYGLLAAAAGFAFIRRKAIAEAWRSFRLRSYTPAERIVYETEKLLRFCRKRGLERGEHETLREAVVRWSDQRRTLSKDFREILDHFERVKYGGGEPTSEEAERFALKAKAIAERL
ncbi:transglutaminase domain-containing protein [Paenibacillus cisolokensis]|uniref:DUF4129 domain-containing transglutaminase family protein n=1 Tax=Paenibacillus cisolokensis TaxID=1658519 RepID=UPI003D2BC7A7